MLNAFLAMPAGANIALAPKDQFTQFPPPITAYAAIVVARAASIARKWYAGDVMQMYQFVVIDIISVKYLCTQCGL